MYNNRVGVASLGCWLFFFFEPMSEEQVEADTGRCPTRGRTRSFCVEVRGDLEADWLVWDAFAQPPSSRPLTDT